MCWPRATIWNRFSAAFPPACIASQAFTKRVWAAVIGFQLASTRRFASLSEPTIFSIRIISRQAFQHPGESASAACSLIFSPMRIPHLALVAGLTAALVYGADAPPQRIISTSPNITEIIYGIGAFDKVVA